MARGVRIAVAASVVASLVLAPVASRAGAGDQVPIVCTAKGPASTWSSDGTMNWSASLSGRCETAGDWIYVKANGSGTSSACSLGTITDLLLTMDVTYTPIFLPEAVGEIVETTHQEVWRSKATPSAGLTPFIVAESGKTVGAGNIGFRFLGSCDKSELTFRWTRMFTMNVLPISCEGTGTMTIHPWYGNSINWPISGGAVCEREGDVWDVTLDGGAVSGDLGLCDPLDDGEGWWSGFSVLTRWTHRVTGETGQFYVYWNVLDQKPVPFSIRTLDGVITTHPDDGCWVMGGSYRAEFRFVVLPVTQSF